MITTKQHNQPGGKARTEEVEETRPLLISMTLNIAAKDMYAGFNLTKQYLDEVIDANNAKRGGTGKAGREKREAIMAFVLDDPTTSVPGLVR